MKSNGLFFSAISNHLSTRDKGSKVNEQSCEKQKAIQVHVYSSKDHRAGEGAEYTDDPTNHRVRMCDQVRRGVGER